MDYLPSSPENNGRHLPKLGLNWESEFDSLRAAQQAFLTNLAAEPVPKTAKPGQINWLHARHLRHETIGQ
jgi:hypothetical protein